MMEGLADRLAAVTRRIAEACRRAGRDPRTVRMLAVSKTHGPDAVRAALAQGVTVFGENRVQEAQRKMTLCPGGVVWHMIGHLQTNKARPAAALFDMIHSVDSFKLLAALDAAAARVGRRLPVLLEVNVAGEATKFGLAPDEIAGVLNQSQGLYNVEINGLMAMPPPAADPEKARPHFRLLRELRDQLSAGTGFELPELSMGMSHDFEVAVEEGATWVRLGTVLFGQRQRPAKPD